MQWAKSEFLGKARFFPPFAHKSQQTRTRMRMITCFGGFPRPTTVDESAASDRIEANYRTFVEHAVRQGMWENPAADTRYLTPLSWHLAVLGTTEESISIRSTVLAQGRI
jgi:hypothetical protein